MRRPGPPPRSTTKHDDHTRAVATLKATADDIASLERRRREAIRDFLATDGGNITTAARIFGVTRNTVYRWLGEL